MGETRRGAITRLLELVGALAPSALSAGCTREWSGTTSPLVGVAALLRAQDGAADQLQARPQSSTSVDAEASGLRRLGLDDVRDALLYVPAGYQAATPAPLVLSLHGAGGDAEGSLYPLQPLADDGGFLLLAVASRGRTWDAILGGFGPDVAFVDQALAWTFQRYAVEPEYVAVAGFSDGASYALSLGLANGDLFGRVRAFSPGFVAPPGRLAGVGRSWGSGDRSVGGTAGSHVPPARGPGTCHTGRDAPPKPPEIVGLPYGIIPRRVCVRALRAWRALLEDDAPAVFRRMSKWGQLVTPA